MFDFETCPPRKGTGCGKWDNQGGDYIPMWVADMDLPAPQKVVDAVTRRAQHPVYGYPILGDKYYDCVISYYKRLYGFDLPREWIVFVPAVMPGANMACRMLGGTIMNNTPMYPHIRKLAAETQLPRLEVPLRQDAAGRYEMDLDAMEKAIAATPGVTTFILCSPHNPVGRVFSKEELNQLSAFCQKHGLTVISDEIHSELVFDDHVHTPYFLADDWAREHSITLTSGAKTYNIPALPMAFAIIPNAALRQKYEAYIAGLAAVPNVVAMEAFLVSYNECSDWKEALLRHLEGNRDYMEQRIAAMPGVSVTHNEATFLAWIDCRATGIEDPWTFFREKAGVNFNNGVDFGCPGFVRLNFGCTRAQLTQALDQMEAALRERLGS